MLFDDVHFDDFWFCQNVSQQVVFEHQMNYKLQETSSKSVLMEFEDACCLGIYLNKTCIKQSLQFPAIAFNFMTFCCMSNHLSFALIAGCWNI